jgi:hypothetical protein
MGDVGADLHRKRSHVVALDPAGEVVLSRRIASANRVPARLRRAPAPSRSRWCSRPPTAGGWFADLLADAGIPAHMAHPLATKAISAARVSNDAVMPRPWLTLSFAFNRWSDPGAGQAVSLMAG